MGGDGTAARGVVRAARPGGGTLVGVTTPISPPATGVDGTGWAPELALLLGEGAGPIVAALAGEGGGQVRRWWPKQVSHQPARATVVQYRVEVERPGCRPAVETIVAATGGRVPTGTAVFDAGGIPVAAWPWASDPALPGLARALDRHRVAALLRELGVGAAAGDHVQVRARTYRPGRRAVVEVSGPGRWFLKVLRPGSAEALHDSHRSLAPHVPVPESLGWTDDGIVVLAAAAGRTLRDVLRSGESPVPPPAALDALLDRLPPSVAGDRPRRDLRSLADHHGRVVAATVPAVAPQVEDLLRRLGTVEVADHAIVPVHGDFHDAQVLVEDGAVTGLVDVDTAGAGLRADDAANLLAHLSVLALVVEQPEGIDRYAAAVLAQAEECFDRRDLRARVAAAVVGLATGPFRALEPRWPEATQRRLDLAAAWLDGVAPATVAVR
jgi:hypothetical protein